MSKVTTLGGKFTPLEVVQKVPWDKIQNVIVVWEDEEGNAHIHVSEMDWKDRTWLSSSLQSFNTAMSTIDLLERVDE